MSFSVPILAALVATSIQLPGGPFVGMDFIAYEPVNDRVWVPAGNTGKVDVIDVSTLKVTSIEGFATAPARRAGGPRIGPSSAVAGLGVVWIGNRADNQVRGFDGRTLAPTGTVQLDAMPDALAFVVEGNELWVTTPAANRIKVISLESKPPMTVADVKVEGSPEGSAVDQERGIFYTNLEDKDQTLAIDVKTRKVVNTWPTGCGAEGPRGLAFDQTLDQRRRILFVACTSSVKALDVGNSGKSVGGLKTGGGVDNIDFDSPRRRLLVASAKDGTLTIAHVTDAGALTVEATLPTKKGARNPVTDVRGVVFLTDSEAGRVLVIDPVRR